MHGGWKYLQGELQRVTKTLDLQESLVNGCDQEFLRTSMVPDLVVPSTAGLLILYLRLCGRLTSSPPQFGQTFFIPAAHFSQKVHSKEQIIAGPFAANA